MFKVSTICVSQGMLAQVIEIGADGLAAEDLAMIGLTEQRKPVIVLIGGASNLSEAAFKSMRSLFEQVLAPIAEGLRAVVVDGGTDTGVMRLMGQARAAVGGTFPLVGVAPRSLVFLPDDPDKAVDAMGLEPNHTHFVLVPGVSWGDESSVLAQVGTIVAGGAPSLSLMLNGGAITWKDAAESVAVGRRLLVLKGTGRAADDLAAMVDGKQAMSQGKELLATGLVEVVDLWDGALLHQRIGSILSSHRDA